MKNTKKKGPKKQSDNHTLQVKSEILRNCKLFPMRERERNGSYIQITEWKASICSPGIFVSMRKVPVSAPVHWNCKVFLEKKKKTTIGSSVLTKLTTPRRKQYRYQKS